MEASSQLSADKYKFCTAYPKPLQAGCSAQALSTEINFANSESTQAVILFTLKAQLYVGGFSVLAGNTSVMKFFFEAIISEQIILQHDWTC